eukprot:gene6233-6872_t
MSGGFADLGLLPELLQAIEDQGWSLPTDIQDEAIPLILGGGDVMGAAETGSGKSAAFALPILQVGSDRWLGIRTTHGVNAGRYYYEVHFYSNGNARIGWSTRLASLDLGKDPLGFGYGGKGFKSSQGNYEKYGETYGEGDIIGCAIDFDHSTITFSKNGKVYDIAYTIPREFHGMVFFPTLSLSGSKAEINLGQLPIRYLPSGYQPFHQASPMHLFQADSMESYRIPGHRKPLAIIIEPTRDLAEQMYRTFMDLSRYLTNPSIRTLLLIGDNNNSHHTIKKALEEGVDIVIGTLGKLGEVIKTHQLDLSAIRFFILDEADSMMEGESLQGVKQVFSHCPIGGIGIHRLQVCFFSATLHDPAIRSLADMICVNPIWIDLKGQETVIPHSVHHVLYRLTPCEESYRRWVVASHSSTTTSSSIMTDEVHVEQELTREGPDRLSCQQSQWIKMIKPFIAKALIDHYKIFRAIP